MDEKKEDQENENGWERKALEEVTAEKKRKELAMTVQKKFIHSADLNAKEAEKENEMALLVKSNASGKGLQEIMKKDIPRHGNEIKEVEDKLKLLK